MDKKEDFITAIPIADSFRIWASTNTMNRELEYAQSLDAYLEMNKKNMIPHNLAIHLELLLLQKQLTKADVVRASGIDRKYLYQIFSGEKTPSRDKLIALAFGLHLSVEETQTMLKVSENRELYVRDERDAIILFALQRNETIEYTDNLLYEHGFKTLTHS